MAKPNPHAKPVAGGRFAALKQQIAGEKGADADPKAKFMAMAAKGKK